MLNSAAAASARRTRGEAVVEAGSRGIVGFEREERERERE